MSERVCVSERKKVKKERQKKKLIRKNYVNVVSIEFVLRVIYIGKNVIRYYRIFFFFTDQNFIRLETFFTLCVRDNRNSRTKRNDYEKKKR